LGVLVAGLAIFVFGVSMEATASAPGVIVARGERDLRSVSAGLLAWEKSLTPGDEVQPGQTLGTVGQGMKAVKVLAPEGQPLWLVISVHAEQGEHVEAGQRLLTVVPVDPTTHRPRELLAWLDMPEEHVAEIATGQTVRLTSNMYNERIHGQFEALIERIEPLGRLNDKGKRTFRVQAAVKETPANLMLGSGVKAEIVIGKKRVWRIILEH
jgi:hypothetical protein